MQFSETVVAAMIGAIATMSTALFQLFNALRNRNKLEVRPKKGRTARSVVAVVALMIASGVGGFLYAELRQQHAAEDIRGMREELNAKLQTLAVATERLMQARDISGAGAQPMLASSVQPSNLVESVVYAPACQAGISCTENTAQRLALCGAVPNAMQVNKVDLFARTASSPVTWEQSAAKFEEDLGGAKFSGTPSEHSQGTGLKTVCVDFIHWSAEAHIARVVLQYGAPVAPEPTAIQQTQPAVAVTQSAMTNTQAISVSSP